jgi:hypothetical protein
VLLAPLPTRFRWLILFLFGLSMVYTHARSDQHARCWRCCVGAQQRAARTAQRTRSREKVQCQRSKFVPFQIFRPTTHSRARFLLLLVCCTVETRKMDGSSGEGGGSLTSGGSLLRSPPYVRIVGFASCRRAAQAGWPGPVASPSAAASSPLTRRLRDAALSPAAPGSKCGEGGDVEGGEAARGAAGGEHLSQENELSSGSGGSSSSDDEHARAPGEPRERQSLSASVTIPGDRRRCVARAATKPDGNPGVSACEWGECRGNALLGARAPRLAAARARTRTACAPPRRRMRLPRARLARNPVSPPEPNRLLLPVASPDICRHRPRARRRPYQLAKLGRGQLEWAI